MWFDVPRPLSLLCSIYLFQMLPRALVGLVTVGLAASIAAVAAVNGDDGSYYGSYYDDVFADDTFDGDGKCCFAFQAPRVISVRRALCLR